MELDHEVECKYWPHPADTVTSEEVVSDKEATLQVFTDGSKQEQRVGAGAVVFKGSELVAKVQLKLDNRCSNNQAEQLAILKVLETIESMKPQHQPTYGDDIYGQQGLPRLAAQCQ
jgi:ribonuclease HI